MCVHVLSCFSSCLTLCDPMDCSPLGSSVHGIHSPPSKRLEWVAISTSRVSSRPTNKTQGSSICLLLLGHGQAGFLPLVPPGKPHIHTAAAATAAKSHQSCPTLCDPIDGSSPGSSIPGILQARTLEWVAISCSNIHTTKHKLGNQHGPIVHYRELYSIFCNCL